jgi:hypothetical protein
VGNGLLTNTGTLQTLSDAIDAPRVIRANVLNLGRVIIGQRTTFEKSAAVYENRGTWIINAAVTIATAINQRFLQSGGTLTINSGGLNVSNNTFEFAGGDITGQVVITSGTLEISNGCTGTGDFAIRGTSTFAGNIAAAQTVRIHGTGTGTTLTSAGGFTNAGTVELAWASGTNGTHSTLSVGTGILTNTGTLRTVSDAIDAPRFIRANVRNLGSVVIGQRTTLEKTGAVYENQGEWIINAAVTIAADISQRFLQSGGTLRINSGGLNISNNTFEHAGGEIAGQVTLTTATLKIGDGGRARSFAFRGRARARR